MRIVFPLEFVARANRVPILKQLLDCWPSRRTFFPHLGRGNAGRAVALPAPVRAANDFAAGIAAAGFPGVKAFRSTMEQPQFEV